MKNSNGIIGNRSRDLSVCSTVPQQTAPLREIHLVLSLKICGAIPLRLHLPLRSADGQF